tara:strand:- start:6855 stop:7337 length:483 start_codon:yes stop_codon:yes gene_type:complete
MTNQEIWDDCLIRGWKSDINMNMLTKQFISNIDTSLMQSSWASPCYFKDGFDQFAYITDIGIKRRCMDRGRDGSLMFYAGFGGVRAFIAKRSPQISDRLFAGWSADDVLANINSFKWSRSNIKNGDKRKYDNRQNLKKSKAVMAIKPRDLTKKHDWKTVT